MAKSVEDDFVMIDDYILDVTVSEEHEFESDVTDYPVESGSNISDNIRPKPITVTMEGVVSKTPFDHILAFRDSGTDNPPDDAYKLLLAIREDREPVTIRTSLDTFEDMALQSLTIPKDPETGEALKFTAKFQQIQTVTNKRVKRTAIPNGTGKSNFGQLLAKIKALAAIPVISFQQSQRETVVKSFGPPILSTKEGIPFIGINPDGSLAGSTVGIRKKDGRGPLDHYKIQGDAKLDGYVLNNQFYAVSISGGSTTAIQTSIQGRPVTWDYSQNAWVTDDGQMTEVIPKGEDRWKGVTVYNPKNGTGQTF